MAAAISIHASLVYLLTDRWGVYYVIAKIMADILVFGVGNFFLLRVVVFPRMRQQSA